MPVDINSNVQQLYLKYDVYRPIQSGRKRFKHKHGTLTLTLLILQHDDPKKGTLNCFFVSFST